MADWDALCLNSPLEAAAQDWVGFVSFVHRKVDSALTEHEIRAWLKEGDAMLYKAVLADPPWKSQVGGGRIKRGADRHYPLMSTRDLCAMNIPSADDAVLFLWSTWNDIPDALQVIQAWGFHYVSGLPWVKLTRNGVVAIGLGQYLRGCSEPLLFATKGNVPRLGGASPFALLMEENTPLVTPRMEHSRKPQTVYELVQCFPGPYLEVFARNRRDGWDAFGNEADKYVAQSALSLAT